MYQNKLRGCFFVLLFTLLSFNLSAQEATDETITDEIITSDEFTDESISDTAAGDNTYDTAATGIITGKEAGVDFRGEYNRALSVSINVSAFAAVELNDMYTVKGGLALGGTGKSFDIKTFIQGQIGPLFGIPLRFSLAYVYNGLPGYSAHSHTLLPLVSFSGRWAGISIGPGFRFTRFLGASTIYESTLSFSVYANFLDREKLCMGIAVANFSDFTVNNMGAYNPSLTSLFRFNEKLSMINNLELLQSGSVALAANFYGIAYRGGVRYIW